MHDPKLFLLLPKVHKKACRNPQVFIKMVRKCFASPGASQRTGIYWVLSLEAVQRSKPLDWKSLQKKKKTIPPTLQAVVTWSCFRDPNHLTDLLKCSGFSVSPSSFVQSSHTSQDLEGEDIFHLDIWHWCANRQALGHFVKQSAAPRSCFRQKPKDTRQCSPLIE